MKDKEKQTEEILTFMDTYIIAKKIAELIPSKIVGYDGRSKGQHLYIEQKMEIAKEMMKQGVVVWTMDEHAKLVSQVRQEFEHEYKDKVVLTIDEINEKQNEAWDRGIEYGKEIARKETAEKFMCLRGYITKQFHKYHEARDIAESEYKKCKEEMGKAVLNNDWHRCDAIMFILEYIATEFDKLINSLGVEIKE